MESDGLITIATVFSLGVMGAVLATALTESPLIYCSLYGSLMSMSLPFVCSAFFLIAEGVREFRKGQGFKQATVTTFFLAPPFAMLLFCFLFIASVVLSIVFLYQSLPSFPNPRRSAALLPFGLCLTALVTWTFANRKRVFPRMLLRWQLMRGQLDLDTISRVWSRAKKVYRGLIGPGALLTLEYKAMSLVVSTPSPDVEDFLASRMNDPNPTLSAYCLTALFRLGSERLDELPPGLLLREEIINTQVGCLTWATTLREFALAVQEWHESQQPQTPPSIEGNT